MSIHKEYLANQIIKYEKELETEKWADFYREICDKSVFKELLYENEELYYKNKNKNAADFRSGMSCFDSTYLKNINNFKQVADNILRIRKYNLAIENLRCDRGFGHENWLMPNLGHSYERRNTKWQILIFSLWNLQRFQEI